MDPLQRSYSRRSLLPVEQQIIDALGLTIEEYWEFCRLADCKAKERGNEYALVPDIRCDPATQTAVLVSLAISLVSTAASILLAPKPPSAEDPLSPIKTADVRGQTRFAELFGFDSLQDLATLGSIIPLVFARQTPDLGEPNKVIGGIRAKGLLLWSQLLSKGSHQELKMLTTLGLSNIAAVPDAQGLAIGDQLLRNYQEARYKAYFLNITETGGRIDRINQFAGALDDSPHDDIFLAFDRAAGNFKPLLSGTRTPNSQRAFGCHSPISNGAPYYLPYDIVQIFDNDDTLKIKRIKINRSYSSRQGMERLNNAVVTGTNAIAVGDTLTFRNSDSREDPDGFLPHGLDDVNTAIDQRISLTDSQINIGDLFMFGSAVIQCTDFSTDKPFEEGDPSKDYFFICKEAGAGYFVAADNDPTTVGNAPFGQHLQRVDIATVTNNRECDQTEIGIKSIVFKRIDGFANVNSEPPLQTLQAYEADKQSFQLGRVSTYQTRYSFFKVEYREVGAQNNAPFIDISAGQIFAVKGTNPQPQYNTLRINHPRGQYEFRIKPVSGSTADGLYVNTAAQTNPVRLLTGSGTQAVSPGGGFIISYTGLPDLVTDDKASNEEFLFKRANQTIQVTGKVTRLDSTAIGQLPATAVWKPAEGPFVQYDKDARQLTTGVLVNVDNPNAPGAVFARWNGQTVQIGSEYQFSSAPSDVVQVVPAELQWTTSNSGVLDRTSGSNDYYVQFDAANNFVNAFYNGASVSAFTQLPDSPDNANALYRVQPNSSPEIVDVPAQSQPIELDVFQENVFDPIKNRPAYFGVWVTATGVNAFWDGVLVTATPSANLSTPGIQYIYGNVRSVIGSTTIRGITRTNVSAASPTGKFYPIEKGSYAAKPNSVALNLYKIQRYVFDSANNPFASTSNDGYNGSPAEYAPVNDNTFVGSGLKINASSFITGQWQWVITAQGSGYNVGERPQFNFPDGTIIRPRISEVGGSVIQGQSREPLNTKDAIADYPKYDQEKTSHQDGPEHQIVFCNELIRPDDGLPNEGAAQYNDLSLLGLRVLAGQDWTSMGQLSAYLKEGIQVERLIDNNGSPATPFNGATNNFAEIAYNLLVSDRLGAGKKIPRSTVDRDAMTTAARFCHANKFTFDGVIGERTALREFIFSNAALNLLDFTIIGGKFSLTPSVPYNATTYKIEHSQDITKNIKALFTDGNMKDMQISFLPAQERQLFKATVAYRQEVENGFSSQEIVQIRFADTYGGSDSDPEEFMDLTSFCTNRYHAETIAQYKLMVRKYADHTIDFKTTPSSALGLTAGDYIKIVSNASHTSRFNNGSVDQFGGITSTTDLGNGSHTVFFWRPGETALLEGTMTVSDGKTGDSVFFESIFTKKMDDPEKKRVYRVNSLTIDSEGFVDVNASYQELTSIGSLATINLDASQFLVTR